MKDARKQASKEERKVVVMIKSEDAFRGPLA
jgi:hypothetical protein